MLSDQCNNSKVIPSFITSIARFVQLHYLIYTYPKYIVKMVEFEMHHA